MSLLLHRRERTHGASGAEGDPPVDGTGGHEAQGAGVGRHPAFIRSPEYLARLIIHTALFVVLAVSAWVFDRTFDGFETDLSAAVLVLHPAAGSFVAALVLTVAFAVVALGLVAAHLRAGLRFVAVTGLAAIAAMLVVHSALVIAVARGWTNETAPSVLAFTAGAVAVLVLQREQFATAVLRTGWWLLVPVAVASSIWTHVPVGAALLTIVAAAVIGDVLALAGGTPSRAPTAEALAAGLEHIGLRVDEVMPAQVDARASVPWRVRLVTGREIFVKTASSEERSAELMFRIWRAVRLRRPGDGLPDSSLRRAVEHEAFVATRAAAVGVRTPKVVNLGRLDDGVFAAYEAVEGCNFAEDGADITPAALRDAWSMCRAMQRAGIAHRDLRAANLLLDESGDVWIVDFGFAELAASDRQLRHDIVELVASTAAVVGVEAAVNAAREVLGREALVEALPYVQPAAVSNATRKALGKEGFRDLHRGMIEATGAPEPEAPRLERVRPKTVLVIVALGVALWVLLPQVTQKGDLWGRVSQAQLGWVLAAVLCAAGTYVAATASLLGAVPGEVPAVPAFASQVASSFTNRITPGSVGGLALNLRFLSCAGSGTAAAATAVGVSTTAGAVVHVLLMVFALAWAGTAGLGDLTLPDARTLVVTGAVVFGVIGIGLAVPGLRRFLMGRLAKPVKQSVQAVSDVAHQPRRLLMLFGGSVLVTVGNAAALVMALHAFGVFPAISTVAVVYLAGSAVGSAAPTPGGLGAVEATLVAGLTATGVGQDVALASVLLFRIATFWLPILPGWLSFVMLQRRGYL